MRKCSVDLLPENCANIARKENRRPKNLYGARIFRRYAQSGVSVCTFFGYAVSGGTVCGYWGQGIHLMQAGYADIGGGVCIFWGRTVRRVCGYWGSCSFMDENRQIRGIEAANHNTWWSQGRKEPNGRGKTGIGMQLLGVKAQAAGEKSVKTYGGSVIIRGREDGRNRKRVPSKRRSKT